MPDKPDSIVDIPVEDIPVELDVRIRQIAHEIARYEVGSMCALFLRRLQDMGPTRSPDRNAAVGILNELYGEALRDFTATENQPGGP